MTAPRQLIIVDACRNRDEFPSIGRIPWPVEKWLYATGYSFARELFNQFITDSGFGKMVIYATEDNNSSYDNKEGRGGEFTLSLLDSVLHYQQTKRQGPLFIKDILNYSTTLLQQRQILQTPCIVYEEGFLKVPFGIISPTFIPVPTRRRHIAKTSNDLSGVFIGAALLLTAYALYKSP
jgi:Caspase domain